MAYNKETGMYEGYIYLITNKINNKKYIGQTTRTIKIRISDHFSNLYKNYAITNAIKKYGKENFEYVEIEKICCETLEALQKQLNIKEPTYIKKYNTLCEKYGGYGYNIDEGGGQATYFMKAVDMYDLNGCYISTFKSQIEAAAFVNIGFDRISKSCRSGGSAGGYFWKFHGEKLELPKIIPNRPIDRYSLDGKLLESYKCINDISDNKKLLNRIRNNASGRCLSVDGFVYRYNNDSFDKYRTQKKIKPSRPPKEKVKKESRRKYDDIKIKQYNSFMELDAIYNNVYEIDCSENISQIIDCCNGKRFSVQDKIYRFEKDDLNKYPIYIFGIKQYNLQGDLIRRWDSCICCETVLNIPSGSISKSIRRKTSCYGFIFTRYDEEFYSPKTRKRKQ